MWRGRAASPVVPRHHTPWVNESLGGGRRTDSGLPVGELMNESEMW